MRKVQRSFIISFSQLLNQCFFLIAGSKEVDEEDDMFILVAPQNAVGNCIIDVRILRDVMLYMYHFVFNNLEVQYAGSKSHD